MNKNPFEFTLNRISDVLVKQLKTTSINIQAFGRKDADTWMEEYFYQFEGEFENGKANGVCKRYNECGVLIQEGVFLDGNPVAVYDYSYDKSKVIFYISNVEVIEKDLAVDIPRLRKRNDKF